MGMGPTRGQKRKRLGSGRTWHAGAHSAIALWLSALLMGFASPAYAADFILTAPSVVLVEIVLSACALGLAGALWGLSEYRATRKLRAMLRATSAKARALLAARDAWLSASREVLMVWGSDLNAPLSFGNSAELMEACLTGPDATALSTALDALAANGSPRNTPRKQAQGKARR